ncbi:helix-turn-helix transcriptional regulator [Anoxybacillus flavithermus]|nr:helix-turn-helix transcriptional regulator [Anoxybacillus flavithermus]
MLKPKIKVRLAELNMKQQELSKKLGVTKQTLNSWVNGRSVPTLETSFRIAKYLNCKVDDLFVYEEDDNT